MKPLTNIRNKSVLLALLASTLIMFSASSNAQLSYSKGQHIEPAYEGWEQLEDGSYNFIFGYMNNNWQEKINIPVGEDNQFSPGPADRGQPTHFLPRRNRFIYKVNVPADWGDKELVWTLTSHGVTKRAYATLRPDYIIDNIIIASENGSLGAGTSSPESRANIPPTLTVNDERLRGEYLLRPGEKLTLRAHVEDDGIPKPRSRAARQRLEQGSKRLADGETPARALRPPTRITVGKTVGLHLSWFVYRGAGEVTFDPPQVKIWEDTRTSANSPWGALWVPPPIPEDGWYEVEVTFSEPGDYVLGARADDGGLFTDQYVTVRVSP